LLILAWLPSCGQTPPKSALSPRTSKPTTAPVVELCDVIADPGRFDGKRIAVDGCITTDGREYTVLANRRHPCSGGGIVPVEGPDLPSGQRLHLKATEATCGTFKGIFRKTTLVYDRVLEIDEIDRH